MFLGKLIENSFHLSLLLLIYNKDNERLYWVIHSKAVFEFSVAWGILDLFLSSLTSMSNRVSLLYWFVYDENVFLRHSQRIFLSTHVIRHTVVEIAFNFAVNNPAAVLLLLITSLIQQEDITVIYLCIVSMLLSNILAETKWNFLDFL